MKDYVKLGKFLSLILRHKPEEIGIVLDPHGWADVPEILQGMKISMEDLEYIVENNNKKRYSFNEDKSKIRANQGHSRSLHIDLELKEKIPPAVLFHGTKRQFLGKILEQGLKPMQRDHVHLSDNVQTAKIVSDRRKGESVLLQVDAARMVKDGQKFYLSENNVWLTEKVSPEYLSVKEFK